MAQLSRRVSRVSKVSKVSTIHDTSDTLKTMSKTILLLLTLVIIVGTALATYYINTQKSAQVNLTSAPDEFRRAAQMATEQYQIKKKAGVDFRLGPCLDNNL